MLKTTLEQLPRLFAAIAAKRQLYMPVKNDDNKSKFTLWRDGVEADLDSLLTARSAKDFFFLPSEVLAHFTTCGQNISIEPVPVDTREFVLFGVRPCDAKSLEILDKVFLSQPVDSFYQNRRELGVIISLSCAAPEETCFCDLFGIDAASPMGDIALWPDGDQLFWLPQSAKGQELTDDLSGFFTAADAADRQKLTEIKKQTAKILGRLPLRELKLPEFAGDAQEKAFNAAVWERLSAVCLGCGACTYVCPTCHCYDICDFDAGGKTERFRCWDSCMYSDFTNMAHGNPRKSGMERFRQRFMHKLVYFPRNNEGAYACVGCGRCLNICPVNLNITKVARTLGGDDSV